MVPRDFRPVMVTSSPVRTRRCDDSPFVGFGNHWLHSMHSSSSTLSRPSVSSWSSRTRTRTPSLKAMNMLMALQWGQAYMGGSAAPVNDKTGPFLAGEPACSTWISCLGDEGARRESAPERGDEARARHAQASSATASPGEEHLVRLGRRHAGVDVQPAS